MKSPRTRMLAILFTVAAALLCAWICLLIDRRLGDTATFTGWTLLVATISLYALSARKKWITLRVGPVSGWLQVHAYTGTFASIIFFFHVQFPLTGYFETFLASAFLFVAGTGIALGYLSRSTPQRLAAIPGDNHQDLIPALQANVAEEAHARALASTAGGEGATLAEYYQQKLLPYFRTPRGMLYTLLPTGNLRRRLLRELNDLDRYLGPTGLQERQALTAMVQQKDDLDYQFALQYRLKLFFMLHVSLVWSLALMIAVHVVLVYRFQGTIH